MCRCPLEQYDSRMTSVEPVAVAGGALVAGSPEWPHATPQTLGRPGRARVAIAALVWLLAGASMSSLNKWIFTVHGFGRPLLLSALHMLAAALACYRGAQHPMPRGTHRQVLLLSLTFGTSMACGNVGLSAVPLDLAQLATTTTPLITLALSALLLGRRHHPLQFAAMGPLCLGAACSLAGELRTPPAGCGFLLAATCLRGLKSIQQSALLQEERLDAVTLLYATSLPSFCRLLPPTPASGPASCLAASCPCSTTWPASPCWPSPLLSPSTSWETSLSWATSSCPDSCLAVASAPSATLALHSPFQECFFTTTASSWPPGLPAGASGGGTRLTRVFETWESA
uniref:Solute carrier family 35 member E4 n=1 Tax=Rousettus aegyptiacus TaxID=9407 RepID=A0A7J8H6Z1_ROUAE|nr:solute carrier family 35 member E4 [Rousettus aegyptiacus]